MASNTCLMIEALETPFIEPSQDPKNVWKTALFELLTPNLVVNPAADQANSDLPGAAFGHAGRQSYFAAHGQRPLGSC